MKFITNIYPGDSSEECKHIKTLLFLLGYYPDNVTEITKAKYGDDTGVAVRAFQAQNRDSNGKPLDIDGIIGPLTWAAIEREYEASVKEETYKWTRDLAYGSSGPDVYELKLRLRAGSFLTVAPTHSGFGSDTRNAVKALQSVAGLPATGVVDKATWDALAAIYTAPPPAVELSASDYPNIGKTALKAIAAALQGMSTERLAVVKLALEYAYDPATGPQAFPDSLYIWGANLYDKNRTLQLADAAMIREGASSNPGLFDAGRKEMMLAAVAADPRVSCSDCSGGIVGIMRALGFVKASFDKTANTLAGSSYSTSIKKAELLPGDWVSYSGHIGIYVGGGYVVEWAGGAWGCQLTELSARKLYSFVSSPDGKTYKKGTVYTTEKKWTKYRRPNADLYA